MTEKTPIDLFLERQHVRVYKTEKEDYRIFPGWGFFLKERPEYNLDEQMSDKLLLDIFTGFDGHHWIHSKHWWGDTVPDDYPSKHPVRYKNGICLHATDFNDGRVSTFLFIRDDMRFFAGDWFVGEERVFQAFLKHQVKGWYHVAEYKAVRIEDTCKDVVLRDFKGVYVDDDFPRKCPRKHNCDTYLCDFSHEKCLFKKASIRSGGRKGT